MFEKEPKSGDAPRILREQLINSVMDEELRTLLMELDSSLRELRTELHQTKEKLQPAQLWIGSSETCRLLGISTRSLQNYRDQRRIPFRRINGKILYNKKQISTLRLK